MIIVTEISGAGYFFEAEGRRFVIRSKLKMSVRSSGTTVRGQMSWRGSDLGGDMVVARASVDGIGQPLYNFAGGR